MAARTKRIIHDANTRAKIRTSQLANRLTDHALGKIDLEPTQVRAIEILLKKTLPDLSSVEMNANITTDHESALDELEREEHQTETEDRVH